VSMDCKITAKLLQYGQTTIPIPEPGVVTSSGTGNVSMLYTPQPGSSFLLAGAYLSNLRVIWERTGTQGFFQARMPRALCTKYDITSKDKDESEIDAEFEGRLDLTVTGNTSDTPIYFLEQLNPADISAIAQL
jgi:hypothetical protein